MPASWSPSNGVTVPEQPASLASLGSANHNPRCKVCTGANFGPSLASWSSTRGAFTLAGLNAKVSSLKMPMTRTSPLPWLSVSRSPWYQETPKGSLGCWMTNRVKPVFLAACLSSTSMIWFPPSVWTSTLALAPSRQSLSTADWERTILKVVSSTAKAAAANKTAISSAPPTTSTTRLVVEFVLTFLFLSWFTFFFVPSLHPSLGALSAKRALEEADCVSLPMHPLPPLWACLHKQIVSAAHSGPPALGVFGCSRCSVAIRLGGGASGQLLTTGAPLGKAESAPTARECPRRPPERPRSTCASRPLPLARAAQVCRRRFGSR